MFWGGVKVHLQMNMVLMLRGVLEFLASQSCHDRSKLTGFASTNGRPTLLVASALGELGDSHQTTYF